MFLSRITPHRKYQPTAAPDDKKVVQEHQNSDCTQLLEINNSLSQTYTDIGLLLTERQESEGYNGIVTEVRALLDKNNAAMSEILIESDQGA